MTLCYEPGHPGKLPGCRDRRSLRCVLSIRESISHTPCSVDGVRRVVNLNPRLPPAPTSAGAFASCRVALDASLELRGSAVSQVRSPYAVPRHVPALPISAHLASGCPPGLCYSMENSVDTGASAERVAVCNTAPRSGLNRLFHPASTDKICMQCIFDIHTRFVSMLHDRVQSRMRP